MNATAFTLWLAFATATLFASGCTTETAPAPKPQAQSAVEPLLLLIRDRLLIMHDVAKAKWNADLPIADLTREQTLISELIEATRSTGINADLLRYVMTAQLEAGKQVQQADFDAWQASHHAPFPDAPDLRTTIRPQIDQISRDMVKELAALAPKLDEPDIQAALAQLAPQIIRGPGITAAVRETAMEPLLSFQPAAR